ncbi:hypothetical protein BASA61_001172 [Batrachochytrium salamandrivorans]|nr:hypothetical protein BASA62_002742 [Batrachochytrium salamandrivorans]KAH6602384.1 hypothetical protein BASA61_001172 [Batrachochytrium salamandrivorans]
MKVKALVVAAMVITSVNAGGRGGFKGWLRRNGRMTRSGSLNRLLDDDSLSILSQDLSEHMSKPVVPQNLPGSRTKPTLLLDSTRHKPDKSQVLEATEKDKICSDIDSKLLCLRNKIMDFDDEFLCRMGDYYRLMKEKNKEDKKNEENQEDEKSDLKAKEVQDWLDSHPEESTKLEGIKTEYDSLMEEYRKIWEEFIKEKCRTEDDNWMSAETLIEWDLFFQCLPVCITRNQILSTYIAHLAVECKQVTGHRIQSGLVPAIQKSRLRLLGRALDPGVENVYTWLRGGVLNGEADLDQQWLDGTVEHESMGTRHDNRALAARLTDFLQVVYRQYQSILWKYHRDRLVDVG